MSNTIKRALILLVAACILIASLASCGEGRKKAKALINDFFTEIVAGNYEKAEALMHHDVNTDLEALFKKIKAEKGVDIQKGFESQKYVGYKYAFNSSEIGGTFWQFSIETKIDGTSVGFTVRVIENDNGYGIDIFNVHI